MTEKKVTGCVYNTDGCKYPVNVIRNLKESLDTVCKTDGLENLKVDISTRQIHELNISHGTILIAEFPSHKLRIFPESA